MGRLNEYSKTRARKEKWLGRKRNNRKQNEMLEKQQKPIVTYKNKKRKE